MPPPIDPTLTTGFDPISAFIILTLMSVIAFLWKRSERMEAGHKQEISAYNKMYLELIHNQERSASKHEQALSKVSDAIEAYQQSLGFSKLMLDLFKKKMESDDD